MRPGLRAFGTQRLAQTGFAISTSQIGRPTYCCPLYHDNAGWLPIPNPKHCSQPRSFTYQIEGEKVNNPSSHRRWTLLAGAGLPFAVKGNQHHKSFTNSSRPHSYLRFGSFSIREVLLQGVGVAKRWMVWIAE